jgi:hypothetical protein
MPVMVPIAQTMNVKLATLSTIGELDIGLND